MQNNDAKRYSLKQLEELSIKSLKALGINETNAKKITECMLDADINGVHTHGIRMLPAYIDRLKSGQFSSDDIEITKETPSFTKIDAKSSVGILSAISATEIAINKANKYGIHTVFVNNANTYGPAYYYVELMAKKGLIGFTCSNSPAAMPAVNGLEKMLGTNPFAFAFPTLTQDNFILDMATSIVAKSKFETCRLNGEKLGPGWALDINGNPTDDPIEAIKGFVLPMAGFKGYGIAMMIDMLSGMLSGAAYLNKVGKFYSNDCKGMNVGQIFISIDPKIVYGDDFYLEADEYIKTLRNSKSVAGKKIVLPGDDRKELKDKSLKCGVVLSDDTVEKLQNLFGNTLILN